MGKDQAPHGSQVRRLAYREDVEIFWFFQEDPKPGTHERKQQPSVREAVRGDHGSRFTHEGARFHHNRAGRVLC